MSASKPGPQLWDQVMLADAVQVETQAVTRHLEVAGRVLSAHPTPSNGSVDPLLASLAVVFERLGKLTLGSANLADHGAWIEYSRMKEYSHKLSGLCADVSALVRTPSASRPVTNPGLVAQALAAADADPFLPTLVDVLRSYGSGGRYDRLDYLAGHDSGHRATVDLWRDLETQVARLDPALLNESAPFEGPSPWRLATSAAVARSTAVWVTLIRSAWVQGAAGPAARAAASHLSMPADWPSCFL